jgi:hypothetical protein
MKEKLKLVVMLLFVTCYLFMACENPMDSSNNNNNNNNNTDTGAIDGLAINTAFSKTGLSVVYDGYNSAAWKGAVTAIKIISGETVEQTIGSGDYQIADTITVAKNKINGGLEGNYKLTIAATGFDDVSDNVRIDTKAPVITITNSGRSSSVAATLTFSLNAEEHITAGVGTGYFVTQTAADNSAETKAARKAALNMSAETGSASGTFGSKAFAGLAETKVYVWVYAIDDYENEGEAEAAILPYLAKPTAVSIPVVEGTNALNTINASNVEDVKVKATFAELAADSFVEFEISDTVSGSVKTSVSAGQSTTDTESANPSLDASAIQDILVTNTIISSVSLRARIYTTATGVADGDETASSDWTASSITKHTNPPVLSGGAAAGLISSAGTTASVNFSLDVKMYQGASNYWWVALDSGETAPTIEAVKAYSDSAPHGTAALPAAIGTNTVRTVNISITGLTVSNTYKVYVIATDAAGNTGNLLTVSGVNPIVGSTAKLYLDSASTTQVVDSGESLAEILAWLKESGTNTSYTIKVSEDDAIVSCNSANKVGGYLASDTVTAVTEFNSMQITLIGVGGEKKINTTSAGYLFYIGANVTIVLGENITARGWGGIGGVAGGDNTQPLFYVATGGTLKIGNGAKIVGNKISNAQPSAVYLTGGTFLMEGGEISGHISPHSAIYLYATASGVTAQVTMSGGTIKDDEGGIRLGSKGVFTMTGGEIINNKGVGRGGAFYVQASNTVTIGGNALIANNNASVAGYGGGGLYIMGGTVTIKDNAVIKGNQAAGMGGGVFIDGSAASFYKTGNSVIYGDTDTTHTEGADENTAIGGKGHAVYQSDTFFRDTDAPAGADVTVTPSLHIGVDSTGHPQVVDIIDPATPDLISIGTAKPEAGKLIANGTNSVIMGADGTGTPDVKWAKDGSAPAAGGTWYDYNSSSLEAGGKFAEHAVYHTKIVLTANEAAKFEGAYTPVLPAGASLVSATVNGTVYGNSLTIIFTWAATTITAPNWTAIAGGTGTASVDPAGASGLGANPAYDIAYGNSTFVAVAGAGRMAYSSNGTSWTGVDGSTSTFTTSSAINGIAYGNSKFVAVGAGGKMAYSEAGTSWTAIAGGTTEGTSQFATNYAINDIAWGSDKFVAVGAGGKMAYSSNGTSWTAVADSTFSAIAINSIAYGSGKFVAVGASGMMAYSSNGTTWTAISGGTGTTTITVPGASTFGANAINNVTYGDGMFVAVGASGVMACSEDGVTWVPISGGAGTATITTLGDSTFGANAINGIIYGADKFVAVGAVGRMAYSD